MSEWIAAWLAAQKHDNHAYDVVTRDLGNRVYIWVYHAQVRYANLLLKLHTARQERDYARKRLQQLREYWEIDRNQAIALDTHVLDEQQADKRLIDCVYELGRAQRELVDARETIAALKAERDEALSRLGAIRLGAMEE